MGDRPRGAPQDGGRTIDRQTYETNGPEPGSLEARASLALKILAAINVAGIVMAQFPPIPPVATLHTVMFNLAAGVLAVLYVIEARALDRGRPWAHAAVRPLLLVIAASGAYAVVVAFGGGRIRLPYELALVVWAWRGRGAPDTPRVPRPGRRSAAVIGAATALVLSMSFGSQLFGWGGALDVHEPDLTASLAVDCGPAGAGLPPSIIIGYDWSWKSTSPIPSGLDIVVVGWTGADEQGRPLYILDNTPEPGGGIHPGLRDYPSIDLAGEVAKESVGSWNWGIELSEQRLAPGRFEAQLRRTRDVAPGPRTLAVTASYVHLGLWRHDVAAVTCAW
jgi:hypothetical protein